MKANIKVVYALENIAGFVANIIPEKIQNGVKSMVIGNKRSQFLSNSPDFFRRRIFKAINNFSFLSSVYNFRFEDKRVIEYGTGGHGVDLVTLYLLGVKEIYTYDIAFFGFRYLRQAIVDYENHLSLLADTFSSGDITSIKERYDRLAATSSVQEAMQVMNINWSPFSSLLKDKVNNDFENEYFDLFFSESNLQRIPIHQIEHLVKVGLDALKSGGYVFHRTDMGDISTQKTRPVYDPKLWRFEFLKYSDRIWSLLSSERMGSQNRLRQPEYIRLFKKYGITNFYIENYYYKKDVEKMSTFRKKLNTRFSEFSDRENAIAHTRFIGIKEADNSEITERDFEFTYKQSFGEPTPNWREDQGLS